MEYTLRENWLDISIESLFVDTIQDFFDSYIPSKKVQHLLIQNKNILLDGNPVKREDPIVGLYLNINLYPETYVYPKCDLKPDIVYEDEILLIVNKPKDLLVHSNGNEEETLVNMVASYLDNEHISAYPIHRLDKETSGLVIFSKSPIFQPLLDQYIMHKQIRRNYYAFVKGIMEEGQILTINKPIGKDRHDSNRRIITASGQEAITKVDCLGNNKKDNYSVLLCGIQTGRTHQIRVHLSGIGYPILNDRLYGEESSLCKRMGLFAESIEMYHPLKEDNLYVEAELPKDLDKLYRGILK